MGVTRGELTAIINGVRDGVRKIVQESIAGAINPVKTQLQNLESKVSVTPTVDLQKQISALLARVDELEQTEVVQPTTLTADLEERKKSISQWANEEGLSLSPEKVEEIANWKNFSEAQVKYYLRRKVAAREIETLGQTKRVDLSKRAWGLSQAVVSGSLTVDQAVAYGIARKEVEDIAAEVGYTPEVAGDSFEPTLEQWAEQLAQAEAMDRDKLTNTIRESLKATVESHARVTQGGEES